MSSYLTSSSSTTSSSGYYMRSAGYHAERPSILSMSIEERIAKRREAMQKAMEEREKRNEPKLFDIMELDIDNLKEMLS